MNPVTHFFVSWSVANLGCANRRDRALVTLAGVVPDLDGAGLVVDLWNRIPGQPLMWWTTYHHLLGHNLGFGLVATLLALVLAIRRRLTILLVLASFHLHLLCDLLGSRGPDGDQWPIPYLLPFSNAWQWTWAGQWELNAWPNIAITLMALVLTFYLAWQRGTSPLELVSAKANGLFVQTLRFRFGRPTSSELQP